MAIIKRKQQSPVSVISNLDRFNSKLWNDDNGCWIWTGHLGKRRYGLFWVNGKTVLSHRWLYKQIVGDIGDHLHLDHLCRNPACQNPDHLEPVTPRENVMRGIGLASKYASRTHCEKGHELSGDNLIIVKFRKCKACFSESMSRYRRKRNGGHK